jgi:preprotein translocase subunit SecD
MKNGTVATLILIAVVFVFIIGWYNYLGSISHFSQFLSSIVPPATGAVTVILAWAITKTSWANKNFKH